MPLLRQVEVVAGESQPLTKPWRSISQVERTPSTLTCLTKSCVSAALRSMSSGTNGSSFSSTILRTIVVRALARAEDVFELALLQPDEQERRHVGGGARPHLGTDRPPVAVDDGAEDHLLEIGEGRRGLSLAWRRMGRHDILQLVELEAQSRALSLR